MKIDVTWKTTNRTDFTFSLEDPVASVEAFLAAAKVCDDLGTGYTVRPGIGGWNGQTERSYTLSIVGVEAQSPDSQRAIFNALIEAGCEAIQVEFWSDHRSGTSYECQEWRVDA
jgi:hypothetical protein